MGPFRDSMTDDSNKQYRIDAFAPFVTKIDRRRRAPRTNDQHQELKSTEITHKAFRDNKFDTTLQDQDQRKKEKRQISSPAENKFREHQQHSASAWKIERFCLLQHITQTVR